MICFSLICRELLHVFGPGTFLYGSRYKVFVPEACIKASPAGVGREQGEASLVGVQIYINTGDKIASQSPAKATHVYGIAPAAKYKVQAPEPRALLPLPQSAREHAKTQLCQDRMERHFVGPDVDVPMDGTAVAGKCDSLRNVTET